MIRTYRPLVKRSAAPAGLLTSAPMGSRLRGDTGEDAQFLADFYGIPVIGFDRPFPIASQPEAYSMSLEGLALNLRAEADNLRIKRLVAVGRSAGATTLLALARTGVIKLDGIVAADAVGWKKVGILEGLKIFTDYGRHQNQVLGDNDSAVTKPNQSDRSKLRTLGMIRRGVTDSISHARLWSSPVALSATYDLAYNQPEVPLHIIFASDTYVIDDDNREDLAADLPETRQNSDAPIYVETCPDTVHASFDNRQFFAAVARPLIERAMGAYDSVG